MHGLDVAFSWSPADIGIGNFNQEKSIGFSADVLNFTWIEKTTGLGLGFNLSSIYGDTRNNEWYMSMPSFEIMWNPFSKRLVGGFYGTLGIYNKFGWSVDKGYEGFINTTGIRYIFTNMPYGRSKEKAHDEWKVRFGYIFAEYSTTRTWMVGIKVDVLASFILLPLDLAMYYITY
jgi:hypothetical protein